MSQQLPAILDVAGVLRQIPHPPSKKNDLVATILPPLCHCGESSLQKRIALYGGVAATLTPMALHCASKALEVSPKGKLGFRRVKYNVPMQQD